MIENTFLGLGPMSVEVINSLDKFSRKYKKVPKFSKCQKCSENNLKVR